MLNFTWWVNRKDAEGKNVFQGGFLGLDNIGVFDRSAPLPGGGHLEQSDGTVVDGHVLPEHAGHRARAEPGQPAYEDVASKFFEHFVYIAKAMNELGDGITLWDEQDGFYYDVLHMPNDARLLKVRSMVGLIPLFAVETLEPDVLDRLPGFKRRLQWFIDNRPEFRGHVTTAIGPGGGVRRLLSIVRRPSWCGCSSYMLDRDEFLSPHGIRALSRYHRDHPYVLAVDGVEHRVDYEPAESATGIFGGNSNWRGPIWFPVNYLLIESLQKFHHFYGDDLKVECPTGSSRLVNLSEVAAELSARPHPPRSCRGPRRAGGPSTDRPNGSSGIRTGATSSSSTSTSTATTAPASAPATRPAGPAWWPSSSSRAANDHAGRTPGRAPRGRRHRGGALVSAIAEAGVRIADELARAALIGQLGTTGDVNVQGEKVKKLDVWANDVVVAALDATGRTCTLVSEEMEEILRTAPSAAPARASSCASTRWTARRTWTSTASSGRSSPSCRDAARAPITPATTCCRRVPPRWRPATSCTGRPPCSS